MTIQYSNQVATKECVILLHGLARTNRSMEKLAKALNDSGYYTINDGYPSTSNTIHKLAENTIAKAIIKCPKGATIHFVTHSMGGILVRQYLQFNTIKDLGRVVMLGPPSKGSQVVDRLHNVPGFSLINGPAGLQLGTGGLSIPNQLGPANFDVGIIAGTRSINLILSAMLPNPDDGKVSVENTRLEGMSGHISLPVTHAFMMKNKDVIAQVICFLRRGVFSQ